MKIHLYLPLKEKTKNILKRVPSINHHKKSSSVASSVIGDVLWLKFAERDRTVLRLVLSSSFMHLQNEHGSERTK